MEYKAGNFLLAQADPKAAALQRKRSDTNASSGAALDDEEHVRALEEEEVAKKFREQQDAAVREFQPNATLFLFLLGILSACVAFLVDHSVNLLKQLRNVAASTGMYPVDFTIYVLVGMGFVTVAASVGQYISIDAQGSGIPEMKVMLSGVWQKNFLTLNTLVAKVIGLTFACASGLYVGKV